MVESGALISREEVQTAANAGRLAELARQLVLDRGWSSMEVLFGFAGSEGVTLEALKDLADRVLEAAAALPEARREPLPAEIVGLKRLAANTLLHKINVASAGRRTMSPIEKPAAIAAAGLLFEVGDFLRAGEVFERAGDDIRAADAYGALGAIERMEICLAREEASRTRRQAVAEAMRHFEMMLASGERVGALRAVAGIPEDHPDRRSLGAAVRDIDRRLCRDRALTLLLPDGRRVRVAAAPALLGREGTAQIPLRDPGVSRRHATILAREGGLALEDAGSRSGTRLHGAPIAGAIALTATGEITLGDHCRLRYRLLAPGLLALAGAEGVDRNLDAVVGADPVPIAALVPGAAGMFLSFAGEAARLERSSDVRIRIGGRLIGPGCDLLRGDVLEVEAPALRLEIA